ncbi:cop9 complex subunit 7a [Moniliophthora roreri]|nr:cop9 complex subunit 7a [Moniliophthora roreri]
MLTGRRVGKNHSGTREIISLLFVSIYRSESLTVQLFNCRPTFSRYSTWITINHTGHEQVTHTTIDSAPCSRKQDTNLLDLS